MNKVQTKGETPQDTLPVRPVPDWVWVLGAAFFPPGIFIALAIGRAMRWWGAILLAAGSAGMYYVLATIAESGARAAGLAMFWFCIAAGQLQYSIGHRRNLWSPGAKRIWRVFGWIAVVAVVISSALVYDSLFRPLKWFFINHVAYPQ